MTDVHDVGELVIQLHWASGCHCREGCETCQTFTILQADPHIQITAELLEQMLVNPNQMRWVDSPNDDRDALGSVAHFDDGKRHVVYRITGYDLERRLYRASWPD